jgi:class 3 adenylate cyclase
MGMLTVLIVDDDEQVRRQALRALAGPDFKLASAANGRIALEQAALLQPDIIICDVDMPEVNGFDVLAAIKADEKLSAAQVMMLTSLDSRNSMRLGMSLGADDYLTKPFTREELVDAVEGLVKRRGRIDLIKGSAARTREELLRHRFASGISGEHTWSSFEDSHAAADEVHSGAAVLFADIRGFTSIAEKLSSQQVAKLLAEYFEHACKPVIAYGGRYLKLLGDGLMAVFVDDPDEVLNPSQRALLAATEMLQVSRDIADWVPLTFPHARLPPFKVGFGVHCGEVAVTGMGTSEHKAATPIGDAVNVAARLEHESKSLGWDIVASSAVIAQAAGSARTAETRTVAVRNRETPIEVHQVLGLDLPEATGPIYAKTLALSPAVRARSAGSAPTLVNIDTREHADVAARVVKDALGEKLQALRSGELRDDGGGLRLEGFRILRHLGAGGMSTIYLAQREDDGELVVLKVLTLDSANPDEAARFVREYSLLSGIEHPHVVRIFNQGFSEDIAYIAMEYFENGDLRGRMGAGFAPKAALKVLEQVASALAAIHAMGIIHRDLKPENLMVRANGDVALCDFGIAKQVGSAQPTLTIKGELLGSPSYMSPEQIAGAKLTHRTDLYSLGVLLYELMAGQRPYSAATLMELLALQAHAPTPRLPAGSAALQPVLDKLMAKDPAARYDSAEAVLPDLRAAAQSLAIR